MDRRSWFTASVYIPTNAIQQLTKGDYIAPVFMSAQPLVFGKTTAHDVIERQIADEQPLPIRFVEPVEGIELPFYTRGIYPTNPLRRKRRWIPPAEGVPGPIFDTEASANMPFPGLTADPPSRRFGVRWTWRRLVAILSFIPSQVIPPLNATVYSDTLCRLLSEIQRHLLLPGDEGITWDLWTREEVLATVQRRLTRFMEETGIIRERISINVTSGDSFVDLPEDVLQVRRVVWSALTPTGHVVLEPMDEWELNSAFPGWEDDTGTPVGYIETHPQRLRIYPIPNTNGAVVGTSGTVELIVVRRPSTLSGCQNLPIPAIFSWVIKWGVIADLLRKEGEANDPERAKYAEGRYEEGVELARLLLGTEV